MEENLKLVLFYLVHSEVKINFQENSFQTNYFR